MFNFKDVPAFLVVPMILAFAMPAPGMQAARQRGVARRQVEAGSPSGRWLGQDGHDLVGPSANLGPSDVQDIHIAISGLPRDRVIKFAKVTPLGGGEWQYGGSGGSWKAQIERASQGTTADLYLEPSQDEDGRPYHIHIEFEDGSKLELNVQGGRADSNLRMPGAGLVAQWMGQDEHDRVGIGCAVGPDGRVDARIALSNLSRGVAIKAVEVRGPSGAEWASGVNPKGLAGAELIRDGKDPSKGNLFLAFDRDPARQPLQILVRYANDKSDAAKLIAGKFDPKKEVPRPKAPNANVVKLAGRWHGQGGRDEVGPGDVRVTVVGFPNTPIAAAVLSDSTRGVWLFKGSNAPALNGVEYATPMAVHQDDSGALELVFPPFRDETGGTMVLRVITQDGRILIGEFPGGPADPGLRAGDGPRDVVATAKPGDDLQAIVRGGGTIHLTTGRHALKQPLVLDKPTVLLGEPGSSLVFSQKEGDPEWPAAIKFHSGHTRLEGFAIRFASPIRWKAGIEYGPAVIGATDNLDPSPGDLKADLVFRNLDVESPPAPGNWSESPRMIRLRRCVCGTIEDCTLNGGTIELEGGPWRIVGNRFTGTAAGTFSFASISAHQPHDLLVRANIAKPKADSGKVWRFLVMTGSGANDLIESNQIEAIGPRDDDKIPGMNAPEIILTEAYSLHFEGRPLAISGDGRVLIVPELQGDAVSTGDVVSILAGASAGRWSRIAQVLSPTMFLLDKPIPASAESLSIATGFVGETIRKNRIDSRGGSGAGNLVLVGNLYGLSVVENHLLGANAFKITAAPTESPVHWGWSHAPLMGAVIERNIFEDSIGGGTISVEHSEHIRPSRGRVYASILLKGNTVRWSEKFREAMGPARTRAAYGIRLGDPGSLDPSEMIVILENHRAEGPDAPPIRVEAARVNGKEMKNQPLSAVPEPAGSTTAKPRR